MLFMTYTHVIKKRPIISDDILMTEVKEFGSMLGINDGANFLYSNGWLQKFKDRHNLKQYQIYPETGSVPLELIHKSRKETTEFIKNWLSLENSRSLNDFFNLYEKALFY